MNFEALRPYLLANRTVSDVREQICVCTGGDPFGAPPAFGAPSPMGGGGGNPWGGGGGGGVPSQQQGGVAPSPGGSSVTGGTAAPSWPATKESDPFGDLVTLRK